jgi:hypothetical protein
MRRLCLALLATLALAAPLRAQEAAAPAIRDVIQGQIDAFLADDVERAFSYASPGIQGVFRTPENFGRMVRQGYPMVWRPDELRFLELEERGGVLHQRVLIEDGEGVRHLLDYRMEPDGAGGWVIDGVRILEAPEVAA